MATDALSYTGINRAYSDFAGSRACEELINLRPATEGVVPVKDFSVKMADKPFLKFFIHHTTSGDKYIVLRLVNDGDDMSVQYVDGNGDMQQVLFGPVESNGDQTVDAIHFATAGNILLISMCDRIDRKFYNKAWVWKADDNGVLKYVEIQADAPDVNFTIDDGTDLVCVTDDIADIDMDSSPNEVVSVIESGFNSMQENNPDVCFGPVLIATAFKTTDGNTFWTNGWKLYDPSPKAVDSTPPYVTSTEMGTQYDDFFDKYDYGFLVNNMEDASTYYYGSLREINGYGTRVKLTFPRITGWDAKTSIIQSLEVYCSRPVLYMDTSAAFEGFKRAQGNIGQWIYAMVLPPKKIEDMDLGGQLLYHQASIPMASLAAGEQEVNLTFGGNQQVTEDVLDADAGALKRYGRLLSYNARFHYWDSVSKIDVGKPYFLWPAGTGVTAKVFARYADDDQSQLIYLGEINDYTGSAKVVIAPSLNIKEVITYWQRSGSSWIVSTYRMIPSSSYNYSICVGEPAVNESQTTVTQLDRLAAAGVVGITNEEPDAINVTEQYNPFVFRVEHSYKAPGNILDVQPQMAGIVDTSYGRDPLNVFTETGTYALTQGSADVLYGAFLPISNNVISRKGGGASLPTDMGIFFLGDGSLWLLVGRRPQLISDALHLGPHKYIRACDGYKRISGVDEDYSPAPSGVTITPEYDVSDLLSKVTFEEFVNGSNGSTQKAKLSFNRFRMELLVSNRAYPYTYVLSLKYRQWFKIGKCVWQDEAGSDVASTPGLTPGRINVLDLSTEQSTAQVLVHMQTRPFSMGYRYIHMHRIVSMVRAGLSRTAGDKLVLGLYGSDDLQNWKLLAYSKRPGLLDRDPLHFSQIRTTSCARSWRYYTVCIGGPVPPDTDLGPVLVDYKPVIRRIG